MKTPKHYESCSVFGCPPEVPEQLAVSLSSANLSLFAGRLAYPQELGKRTLLTPIKLKRLREVEVVLSENQYYANGLVHWRHKSQNTVNLTEFKTTIETKSNQLLNDHFFLRLIKETGDLYQEFNELMRSKHRTASDLVQTSNSIFSNIASIAILVQPNGFLTSILSPANYLSYISPKVGIYIISYLREFECL